jgi:hypothetical protein
MKINKFPLKRLSDSALSLEGEEFKVVGKPLLRDLMSFQ